MFIKLANKNNYSDIPRAKSSIKYIVIHYTANNGDTARGNLTFSARENTGVSAHFYVDENEVCCSVPFDRTAYHCGAKSYRHKLCRNSNSIGIEMCSRVDSKGQFYFKDETVRRCAEFTAQQMKNYKIPIENVIRHYDVTGKNCPAPFVRDAGAWVKFRNLVLEYYHGKKNQQTEKEDETMVYYEKLEDVPAGEFRNSVKKLVDAGIMKGNANGLHLTYDMVRLIVFLDRAGAFDK